MSCAECNESKYLFEDLQSMLKVVRELEAVPSAESDRYDFILDECEGTFHRYVGHRVRTIHQNAVLGVEIKAMGYNEGYCIVDYMNKWLPHKSMATTSDAFGIEVTEVGMNEPGEGKDETDSLFNTAKSEVRRQVALGVDATTAVEFIQVLNSKSNITGMIARVVEIFRPDMPFDLGTLDNITRFSHFRFEEGGMRCWEQYKIGPGRLFSNADLTKICKNRPLPATS
eukprot:gene22746-27462_t